ncbi:reverse transcriptase domain-containing protein [Tanacetum coccineum]
MPGQGRCGFKSSIPKMLKRCAKVEWKARESEQTTEAEEAFQQMKQLIAELPMLTAPMEKEELIVYLAAAKEMVSAVLMTEMEAKQMPIYFISRALRGPELNYTSMEKLVLALVHDGISCSEYQSLKKDERDPSDLMLRDLAKNKAWKRCGHQFCYGCGKYHPDHRWHKCPDAKILY